MKKLFAFAVVANLLAVFLFAQEARNALLIANGEYKNIPSLSRPVQEGMDLKEALESIGFEVTFIQNATLSEMVAALSEFENKVKNDKGVAFFHYGGHAVQFNKENYLIPVDANTEYNMITYTCINVDEAVMKRMTGETNIVVLDSCRNDPFEEYTTDAEQRGFGTNRGLAAVKLKSKNSIIIYSAQAGHTAQDGIFTPVFTEKITEKGKSLSDVITETSDSVAQLTMNEQVPAVYGRLMSIYLAGENAVSYDLKKTVATGSISVTSEFPGKIYLDGNYQSDISAFETVVLEDVATARYKLEVKGKEANESQVQYTVVKRNEESQAFFKISTGNVSITSEFAGDIYLNTVKKCSVKPNQSIMLENLKPGTYKIEIQGKETQSRTITVTSKKIAEVSFLKTKKTRKNIFAVAQKDVSKAGEIQLFYNHSIFNLYDNGNFSANGFGIDLCGISIRTGAGNSVSFAFECTSGYTFASASIGDEHFTFHEADWFSIAIGLGIRSRFSLLTGVGYATIWQTFENNTTAVSYKETGDAIHCVIVPIEAKFQLGENVSLFGKYKFLAAGSVSDDGEGYPGWKMRHSLNVGVAINCWYNWYNWR
ncbi:MAG: caspase family protein [Treponemataceae bacterium]|nr:caspase family protein [Treponemataceae bacterium]